MPVEKFVLRKESSSFTVISNKVVDGLKKHLEVLGLYLYLSKMPENWIFYKSKLSEECKIGIKKLNRMLKILSNCNLIIIEQCRTNFGRFAHFDILVKNGESFKNIDLNEYKEEKSPEGQNCRTAKTVPTVLTTYKINNNKKKNKEINNIYNLGSKNLNTKQKKENKTEFPIDLKIDNSHREKAENLGLDVDEEFEAFKENHIAKGNRFVKWGMAFHLWLRNAQKYSNKKIGSMKNPLVLKNTNFKKPVFVNGKLNVGNIFDNLSNKKD